ncbi:hypothetical protein [Roseateles sp. P5_E8]
MLNQSRVELRRLELDAAVKEHAELWDAWKVIESKAQPVSTTAGVFLAGVFAYASQQSSNGTILEKSLLVLLAIVLLASVVEALRTIWVVTVSSPHLGLKTKEEVDLILARTQPPDSLEARYEGLLSDTAGRWLAACEEVRASLGRKSGLLIRSLRWLAAAAAITAVLIPVTLFCRP